MYCLVAICTFRRPCESAAGTTLTCATRASPKALFDAYISTHRMRFGHSIAAVQPLLCSGLGMGCRSTVLPNTVLTRPGQCLCRLHGAALSPTRLQRECPPPDEPVLYGLQPDDFPPKRVCRRRPWLCALAPAVREAPKVVYTTRACDLRRSLAAFCAGWRGPGPASDCRAKWRAPCAPARGQSYCLAKRPMAAHTIRACAASVRQSRIT